MKVYGGNLPLDLGPPVTIVPEKEPEKKPEPKTEEVKAISMATVTNPFNSELPKEDSSNLMVSNTFDYIESSENKKKDDSKVKREFNSAELDTNIYIALN